MVFRIAFFSILFFSVIGNQNSTFASTEMIGGTRVTASNWIAHTVVALIATGTHEESLCTASIVAQDLAITAAHCVTSENKGERLALTLVFGPNIKKAASDHLRSVDRVEIPAEWNPGYGSSQDTSDVALLHFTNGLPPSYSPSDLLPFNYSFRVGQKVELAGYGITNAETEAGSGILRKVKVTVSNPSYSPSEIQFDQSQGGGACHGDSGGPAYIVISGHPYLFGITSRGGGQCNMDVIYTKIAAYEAWFTEAVRIMRR